MSLDISELIEFEQRMECIDFVRNGHFLPGNRSLDDPDFYTMHYWQAFDEADAEDKARDAPEPNANETTTSEDATNAFTALAEAHHSPVVAEEEIANPLSALPEPTDTLAVVAEEENWAASLFGDEEEPPIAKDLDSSTDQNTSLTDQADSSAARVDSPTHSAPKSDKGLSLDFFDEYMIKDDDFEDALKRLGRQVDEDPRARVEAPTQLPKSRRHFKDFPKYSPPKALKGSIQDPVQQIEQPVHEVQQIMREIENPVPLVKITHQAEYIMEEVQATQQSGILHTEEDAVHFIDAFKPVNEQALHDEQAVPQMQTQASPDTLSDLENYREHEIMDGILAHELNDHSYIVPEEQSEDGLAGLFGLTLDQAKSGMRNKKAGVRNTMIEKPKPTATRNLLQYAGVKKPKFTKAKVAAAHNRVSTEEQKSYQEPIVPLTGQQIINKPDVATPAINNLPPYVTQEQLFLIHQMATARTKPLWHRAVQEGILRVQQQNIRLMNLQAASQSSGQQALYASLEPSGHLNPYRPPQQALQTLQVEHTDKNSVYPQQQHFRQKIDCANTISRNQTVSGNLQQQSAYLTPGRSPMQGKQGFTYNTPQGVHSAVQESQTAFYPSPQSTPQPAGQASSYGSPNNASQGVGKQSPVTHHMAAFNIPQQSAQMGVYSDLQQAWHHTQQGQQVQPQVYYPPLQHAQQPVRYYSPIPVPQPNGYFAQYDPQNQAQIVAQQHRMQQNQLRHQQIQQSGMQYQPTMEDNLNYNAKIIAQANAGNTKRGFTVHDFTDK